MKMTRIFVTSLKNELVGFLLIIAVWVICSLFYPPYIIPSPIVVMSDVSAYLPGDFSHHLLLTLYRTLAGFALAFFIGTIGGMLVSIRKWNKLVYSLMLALQVLPGTILGVIFLLLFGIGSSTPIMLVAFLTLPTLAINTINGFSKKNVALEQYLLSIKANQFGFIRYLYLPAIVPIIQSNLSLGMSMAVKVVILGEFIGSQDGLGFLLNNARIFFNMKEVFFYLVVLLLFTLVFQAVQSLFFSTLLQKYFYPE